MNIEYLRLTEKIIYEYPVSSERDLVNVKRVQKFIDKTKQPLHRSTREGHITATAFIVDYNKQHALMLHHKKLNMWLPPGGHCDGNPELRKTILRETQEETGVDDIEFITRKIFDIDIHEIPENSKEPKHLHYDIRFLLETRKDVHLTINLEESSKLEWIEINRLEEFTSLPSILILKEKLGVL